MSFTSALFLVFFLPFSIILCYLMKDKYRNEFLCLVSCIFYIWCGIKFFLFVIGFATIAYIFSLAMEKYRQHSGKVLIISIIIYIGALFYYKYLFDCLGLIDSVLPDIAVQGAVFNEHSPLLPLGMSFYIFSLLSYLIEIYWQKCQAQKNIINVYLFILFFPKVVQGPIMRYSDFAKQLENRIINVNYLNDGFERFIKGMAKKVLIADQLQPVVQYAFTDISSIGTLSAWVGIIAYLLQLYYDFSGYTDMALGLGMIFGFRLPENFSHPFISRSVAEFWRRWHISLGDWLKDYVYTPCLKYFIDKNYFSGRRDPVLACDFLALSVTWSLIGIWHGSGFKFWLFGLWWFAFIVYERLRDQKRKKYKKKHKIPIKSSTRSERIVDCALTFVAVVFGMVMLRADSLGEILLYWGRLLIPESSDGIMILSVVDNYVITVMLIGIVFAFPVYDKIKDRLVGDDALTLGLYRLFLLAVFLLSFAFAVSTGFAAFLYEVY